jgi:hypothetical protein
MFGYSQINRPELLGFKETLTASLLIYLEVMIQKCGMKNSIVQEICRQAQQFNISLQQLLGWGRAIGEDFIRRNVLSLVEYKDITQLLTTLIGLVTEQNAEAKIQKDNLQRTDAKIDEILNTTRTLQLNQTRENYSSRSASTGREAVTTEEENHGCDNNQDVPNAEPFPMQLESIRKRTLSLSEFFLRRYKESWKLDDQTFGSDKQERSACKKVMKFLEKLMNRRIQNPKRME